MEVNTPAAISTGIEVWTWVIAEKSDIEVALMGELLSSWSDSIRQEKGIFSSSLKSVPCFISVQRPLILLLAMPIRSSHQLVIARLRKTKLIERWPTHDDCLRLTVWFFKCF